MEFSETHYIQVLVLENPICRGISMPSDRGYIHEFPQNPVLGNSEGERAEKGQDSKTLALSS